ASGGELDGVTAGLSSVRLFATASLGGLGDSGAHPAATDTRTTSVDGTAPGARASAARAHRQRRALGETHPPGTTDCATRGSLAAAFDRRYAGRAAVSSPACGPRIRYAQPALAGRHGQSRA